MELHFLRLFLLIESACAPKGTPKTLKETRLQCSYIIAKFESMHTDALARIT